MVRSTKTNDRQMHLGIVFGGGSWLYRPERTGQDRGLGFSPSHQKLPACWQRPTVDRRQRIGRTNGVSSFFQFFFDWLFDFGTRVFCGHSAIRTQNGSVAQWPCTGLSHRPTRVRIPSLPPKSGSDYLGYFNGRSPCVKRGVAGSNPVCAFAQ